jgi:hypothetical protein
MSKVRLGLLAALAAAVVLVVNPIPASSEIVDEEEVGRFTFGLHFGYTQVRMSEYNENIDVVNHWLTNQGIPLREAEHLKGSSSIKGELRYKFGKRFSFGLGVGNTEAKSSFYVTFGDVNFYARSTVWSAMGYYHLPFVDNWGELADRMSLYVGAGPVLLTNGSTHMRIADRTTEPVFDQDGDLIELDGEGDGRGNGGGLQGIAGASYQLNSRFSVAAEVGYRSARINDLELSNVVGYDRDIAEEDPERREPLEGAILDFFRRPPGARGERGIPSEDIEGNHIPYYSDHEGPLELDFSGVLAHVSFRVHIF